MSKSLVKLIDTALVPATLLVVGKIIGLAITIQVFRLPWTLKEIPQSLLSVRPAFLPEDVITASSYSDLVMYLIMALGFTAVLIQATHFHDTHIKPALLVKLSNNNLLGLVKSSFDIYHSTAIWLIFIWLCAGLIWLDAAIGKTHSWIAVVTLVANIIFTSLLLQDVYREIELSRQNLGTQHAF